MMLKLWFLQGWVKKIMNYVSTTSFGILINDREGHSFKSSRGLRQGCSLSPYLFIIYAEGFSALIQNKVDEGELQSLKVTKDAQSVSHILFVDDSLLFTSTDLNSAASFRRVIKTYEVASGLMVNFQKSSLCFNLNVTHELIENIKNVFGIEVIE